MQMQNVLQLLSSSNIAIPSLFLFIFSFKTLQFYSKGIFLYLLLGLNRTSYLQIICLLHIPPNQWLKNAPALYRNYGTSLIHNVNLSSVGTAELSILE